MFHHRTRVTTLAGILLLMMMGGSSPAWGEAAEHFEAGAVEHNGRVYRVEKSIVNGVEHKVFVDASGSPLTPEQLRAHVAAQEPHVVALGLRTAMEQVAADAMIDVAIVLAPQPAALIGRDVMAQVRPQADVWSQAMRAISRQAIVFGDLPAEQERQLQLDPLPETQVQARRAIALQLDDLKRDAMREVAQRAALAVEPSQNELAAAIARLGGEVTARVAVFNVMFARLDAAGIKQLAQHPLVANIDLDHPGQPELDNHQHSLGVLAGFWANGVNGGVHDVGVLDTGVAQSHPALSSHPFLSNMGSNDTGSHGTGMAGILASTSTQFPGMAHGCDTIVVAQAGSISTSMPGMDFIASTGEPENVNYSFGNGTANASDYNSTDQFFDGVISTFGFMVSKSTGNGGYNASNPTITHPAPAYNLMASANMDDKNTVTRADDNITTSSSVGPTLLGRKKPDITAPGSNSMSCTPSGGFGNIGGTSSASPHTGGGIVLLYDLGVTDVIAGKAVLLNTTDAMNDNNTSTPGDDFYVPGSLWNRRYGWGYLNLGQAYLHGLDVFVDEVQPVPENADFKLYRGQMFVNDRATLVWQRHVAYSGAMFPTQIESLSDLDLRAYRESDNALLASATSAIDNVEQLDVDSDAMVVLKVEAFGLFDPDVTSERFAIATQENFAAAAGPALSAILTHPGSVQPNEPFELSIQVNNAGDVSAHAVSIQISGVDVLTGANPINLGTIAAGASATAEWIVQAPAGAGSQNTIAASMQSNSYGESFTAIATSGYIVGACPDITGDSIVNIDDLLLVINHWGDGAGSPADLNGDGIVNVGDLLTVINGWGACP